MHVTTLLAVALAAGPASPPADAEVTKSRSSVLDIVYDTKTPRTDLVRIDLAVSDDQGHVWKVVTSATPDKDQITFNAPADGLYYLSYVFHTKAGKRIPVAVNEHPPELKLLVDATPPVVRLTAADRVGGEVQLTWEVDDPFPDESATQVAYRTAGDPAAPWTPVSVPANARSTRFTPTVSGPVVVQVTAADLAKNTGLAARQVDAQPGGFVAGYTPPAGPPVVPNPVTPAAVALPQPPAAVTVVAAAEPVAPPNLSPPVAVAPTGGPPPPPAAALPLPAAAPAALPPPTPSPAVFGSGVGEPTFTPVAAAPAAPPSDLKVINYTRFDLTYGVDGGGPSGVSKVDLYVTRDDGKTWFRWSQHPQAEQPLRVVLDASNNQRNPQPEGDYGFRLVPISGAGLSEGPPASGTPPEFRVRVDVTPPEVLGYAPEPHPVQRSAMVLKWQIKDANKSADPVLIEWAENPAGPWASVAGPGQTVPDTGTYTWALPDRFPAVRVYLRFTVTDSAGNKSVVTSRDPFLIDPHKPRARIRSMLPAGPAVTPAGGFPPTLPAGPTGYPAPPR